MDGSWAAVVTILFGVIQDGGGLVLTPGGKPIPIDPLRSLGPAGRDVLRALAAAELASRMEERTQGRAIRNAALHAAKASLDALVAGQAAHNVRSFALKATPPKG